MPAADYSGEQTAAAARALFARRPGEEIHAAADGDGCVVRWGQHSVWGPDLPSALASMLAQVRLLDQAEASQ